MMLKGVPYFGKDNNIKIYNEIRTKLDNSEIEYKTTDMLSFINDTLDSDIDRVITVGNRITYVRDMKFNYRDKKIYIPYIDYDVKEVKTKSKSTHLLYDINNDKKYIRYNYRYVYKEFSNIVGNDILVYSPKNKQLIQYRISGYCKDMKLDIDKMYELYIKSCYTEDEFDLYKHLEGYTLINKEIKGKYNIERHLRDKYELDTEDELFENKQKEIPRYCDVRIYRKEQVQSRIGIIEDSETHKIRTLRFEAYTLCKLMVCDYVSDEKYNNLFDVLENKGYYKVGSKLPLIIKDYWVYGKTSMKNRTYSRFSNN